MTEFSFIMHPHDFDKPNIVVDDLAMPIGTAYKWNPVGLGECLVQFFDGSADSCVFSELVWLNGPERALEYLNSLEL